MEKPSLSMPTSSEKSKLLCMSIKLWIITLQWLKICLLCLMIVNFIITRWVEQGSNNTLWRGGLLICWGCYGEWEKQYYSYISWVSEENNVKGYHDTFESLWISGLIYTIFESIAIFLLFFLIIFNFKIASRYRITFIFKIFSTCLLLFHSIAIISWFIITEAIFFKNCKLSSGYLNRESICATQGPFISIFIEFGIVLAILLDLIIFSYSKIKVSPIENTQILGLETS